jgi:hypothetical protein
MGKAQKKKKTQAWRHNPIRVPDSHLPSGKGVVPADPSKEKQMLPVLNKVCISSSRSFFDTRHVPSSVASGVIGIRADTLAQIARVRR